MPFQLVSDTHYMGVGYWIPGSILFAALLATGVVLTPELTYATLRWIIIFAPIWVPGSLIVTFWALWIRYVRAKFIGTQRSVLLEIKIPRQIFKTPKAMELVFAGLAVGPGETTFIDRNFLGKVRPWWSLEMVSHEGKIHFYVWTWERLRDFTESQFYAQYPDIEIHEVEDYTAGISYDPKVNAIWGMEYKLAKADAYPIKTYIDYELDKVPQDAVQITDPISGIFEKLSAIGPGEQIWVQIIIRQNKGGPTADLGWFAPKSWKKEAEEEIEKLYDASKPKDKDLVTGEITEGYPLLKPAEVNIIKALERSIEKPGFDVGIRSVYATKADSFKGHLISPIIVNIFNSFASGYLNKFNPSDTWHVILDYPWQDFGDTRATGFSHKVLDAYRRRSMFHAPYQRPRFVLTSEELATIYHFPTEETKAPGLIRIESSKGEPPANLPI